LKAEKQYIPGYILFLGVRIEIAEKVNDKLRAGLSAVESERKGETTR
jgi:hypothetical protein